MSQIAEHTGIGRATLYKYFSGVEPILIAWHERHVIEHLQHLTQLRDQPGEPRARLESILRAYALISFERHQHGRELTALVHQREHVAGPAEQLLSIFHGLLAETSAAGVVRSDVPTNELATFCLHALESAGSMSSRQAVERLVGVVMDALSPSR
jgi:AcrR family transcriptional regulator